MASRRPKNAASSRSSAAWAAKVPFAIREPVVPVPSLRSAVHAASMHTGSKVRPR